ncbi:hypothetical protein [Nocardia wallacei]|uniref:hypothetical protein n=1 Tax=Nocardia wallacei TaxID=480035 RepID=UPI002454F663|nr:hypothetical protein [Nocardia wallacei]
MADRDHWMAAMIFQRLTRLGVIDADRTVVCLDSDSLGRVLETMGRDYPEGGRMAAFYPAEHVFRFMRWVSNDPDSPRGLETHQDTTVGMAIAAASAANHDWVAHVQRRVSTAEIERELTTA